MKKILAGFLLSLLLPSAVHAGDGLANRIETLTRGTQWQLVSSPTLAFDTFHPQGFARAGDSLFMSSVEIIEPTKKFPALQDGFDRDTGKGAGHREGTIYHPGIDYDGRRLWVPVAEYRPNSQSIIYRVNPETLEATEAFRFPDHIGGLVYDAAQTLHGVSWGSRRFYTWKVNEDGTVPDATRKPEELRTLNPSHYVDYQDCALLEPGKAACTGITEFRLTPDATPFGLGGIDIVDLKQGRPEFQVPVQLWTDKGIAVTRNAVLLESTETGIRLTAAPEDGQTRLFVYEAKLPGS